ncbi:TPA: hypothetical protein EYN65_04140 [Candidatus Poribacteria bacterium]|nr:hypothetical protein [Candidatus Poribacteria bacterium]HIC03449.1 hypothetical protein [Candidatus Poribacteria bacterium]
MQKHFDSLVLLDLPGGFSGFVEFGDNLLSLATDGVGSKMQISTEVHTRRISFKRIRPDFKTA